MMNRWVECGVPIDDRQRSCVQSCALAHRDGRSEKTEAAIEASCYVPTIGNIFVSGIFWEYFGYTYRQVI